MRGVAKWYFCITKPNSILGSRNDKLQFVKIFFLNIHNPLYVSIVPIPSKMNERLTKLNIFRDLKPIDQRDDIPPISFFKLVTNLKFY